jgi:formylglycine-generating enzyme required for sulfatase activity
VGSLSPKNGIYDLRGNVSEWCADPSGGPYRVLRGGSWEDWIEINLRLEFRVMVSPEDAKNTYGFRCVLVEAAQ